MPDGLRLFVAIYPPASVAEAMVARVSRLDLPRHRSTPTDQIHMTLQFIGDTDQGDLGAVTESMERAAAGIEAITLTPLRLMTLPRHGAARLVAAETDAPGALLEVQRRLAHRLARSPRERAGDRFLPHLTLLRFAGGGVRGYSLEKKLDVTAFRVEAVCLMRSILTAEGAIHREVAAVTLGPG